MATEKVWKLSQKFSDGLPLIFPVWILSSQPIVLNPSCALEWHGKLLRLSNVPRISGCRAQAMALFKISPGKSVMELRSLTTLRKAGSLSSVSVYKFIIVLNLWGLRSFTSVYYSQFVSSTRLNSCLRLLREWEVEVELGQANSDLKALVQTIASCLL